MQALSLVRVFMDGFMMAFFVIAAVRYIYKYCKAQDKCSKSVYALVAMSMVWLGLEALNTAQVEGYRLMGNMTGELNEEHYEMLVWVEAFFEMTTIPIFGVMLLGMSSVKATKIWSPFVIMLPQVVLLCLMMVTENVVFSHIAMGYMIVYCLVVIVLIHVNVRRYQKLLCETYSNTSRRGTMWVLVFMYFLVLQFVLWYVLSYMYRSPLASVIYLLSSLVLWTLFVRRVEMQNFEHNDMQEMMEEEGESGVEMEHKLQLLGSKVEQFCVGEQQFRNPDLTLMDLARAIGTNRAYLSQFFSHRGESFHSYINNLRIEYAEELLRTTDESVTNIYTKSGYSTPNNFRRVFHQKYGCTATEYRSRCAKKQQA